MRYLLFDQTRVHPINRMPKIQFLCLIAYQRENMLMREVLRNKKTIKSINVSTVLLLISILFFGCYGKGEKMVAQKGNKIKVHYKGMLTDGTVFDSSFNREPLEFVLGEGVLIPGFEKAVEGMELNEEKLVEIPSNEAYGEIDTNLIVELSLASLPEDFTAEVGEVIQLQDQSGGIVPGAIIEVGEENIKVDLNSPLAGQDLTFKIKVVGIE